MARTKKRLGKGGDAVDTVSAPELFRSGLMAAARFDISEVEPDFHALAAELMAFGLDHLAPALAELGVEKLADLEFLQECDLQGAGLRVVPRRKLRRALLLSARDAGGEGYAADRTLPFGQPEPGPETSLSLVSEADDAGVAGGSSDARDPGLAQNVTEMLLCMTGVLQQIVRTLKDSDDLLEEVCGGLRVGIVAIREQLMAVEDFVQAASLVERGAASVADAVAEGLLEQNPASAVARAALYAIAPGPHEGIADAKAGARWADAADPTCGAPDKDDLDAFELPRPPESFVEHLPKAKDKAPPAEEVGLDEPVTSDELLSAVCWDPVLEVSAALSSTVAPQPPDDGLSSKYEAALRERDSLAEQLLEVQRQYNRKADSAEASRQGVLEVLREDETHLERRLSERDAALRERDSLADELLEMQRQFEACKRKADSAEASRQEALEMLSEEQTHLERRLSEYEASLRERDSLATQLVEVQWQLETCKRQADFGESCRHGALEALREVQTQLERRLSERDAALRERESLAEQLLEMQQQ